MDWCGDGICAEKLALAKEMGADEVINSREVGFDEEARRLTGGRGVDVLGGDGGPTGNPGVERQNRIIVVRTDKDDSPAFANAANAGFQGFRYTDHVHQHSQLRPVADGCSIWNR